MKINFFGRFFALALWVWRVFVLLLLSTANNGRVFLRQICGLDVCVRKPLVVTCGTLVKGTKIGKCCQSKINTCMHDGHFLYHCYGLNMFQVCKASQTNSFFVHFFCI